MEENIQHLYKATFKTRHLEIKVFGGWKEY